MRREIDVNAAETLILDEHVELSLHELAAVTRVAAVELVAMVEEGLLDPHGATREQWRFPATAVARVHLCQRLFSDLGVNMAGAGVVLELLEELRDLRARIERLELPHRR